MQDKASEIEAVSAASVLTYLRYQISHVRQAHSSVAPPPGVPFLQEGNRCRLRCYYQTHRRHHRHRRGGPIAADPSVSLNLLFSAYAARASLSRFVSASPVAPIVSHRSVGTHDTCSSSSAGSGSGSSSGSLVTRRNWLPWTIDLGDIQHSLLFSVSSVHGTAAG